jgi:hypothetical protein
MVELNPVLLVTIRSLFSKRDQVSHIDDFSQRQISMLIDSQV